MAWDSLAHVGKILDKGAKDRRVAERDGPSNKVFGELMTAEKNVSSQNIHTRARL